MNFLLAASVAAGIVVFSAPAVAGDARCFMHGMIIPKYENQEKTTLSDLIRLHFDVKHPEDKAKCEAFLESYCFHNVVGKGFLPTNLKSSFKPDVDKTAETIYKFSETCKMESESI